LLEAALFVFNDKGARIAPACRAPPPASCPASRMRSEVRRRPSEPPATLPRAEARLSLYNDAVVFVLSLFSQNWTIAGTSLVNIIQRSQIRKRGRPMSRKINSSASNQVRKTPTLPALPPSDPQSRTWKLLSVCVDLLELCIEVTGTIDPAAAWLVAHARDEVTLGVYGERDIRPN
jgi:hypothetical protein